MSTADRRSPPCSRSCTAILWASNPPALVLLSSPPLTVAASKPVAGHGRHLQLVQHSNVSRPSLSGLKASRMSRTSMSLIELRRRGNFVVKYDLVYPVSDFWGQVDESERVGDAVGV